MLFLTRYNNENDGNKIINSILKFEFIETSRSKNIDQNDQSITVELLGISLFKKDNNFEISLLFSKNRIITLSAEVIEATLEDQKINDKNS